LAAIALLAGAVGAAEQHPVAASPATKDVRGAQCAIDPGRGAADRDVGNRTASNAAKLDVRLSELEQRLFDQIHDGRFGEFSLLEAGLIAGGVDRRAELRDYCQRFEELVESLRGSGKVRGTPRQRAEAVFAFLHRSVLHGGYDLRASDLRQAFDDGRFNCVTASLLFNSLAERFELRAVGLEVPGHAMSRLQLPDETLDIETTCPRWFALVGEAAPEAAPAAGSELAAGPPARPAAKGQRALRQVSEVELVATVYYNRGVDLLAEKHFAEAAAANAKAVRLDPENAVAKGNLLATINNWAIDLGTSGEYEKAAELLRLGLATDPRYEAFRSNYVQLFRQWSERLCRSGRYEDAARLLAQAAQEQPGEPFFHEAAVEVLRRRAGK
jgi:tetratricopeptide (TPR) repeat protein